MNKKSLIFAAAALALLGFGVWLLAPELGGGWGWLSAMLRRWQMDLQRELATAVRVARDGGWSAAGPLAAVSFLYGVAHAAGPGHGKAVIGAYVLADGRRLRRGLGLAWISAGLQAVTAVTLVGGAVWVFGVAARDAQIVAVWMERAGYALVLALGLVMLWRGWARLRSAEGGHACGHHHHHHSHRHHHDHHAHDHHHDHHDHAHGAACGHVPPPPSDDASWKEAAVLAVSVGLRPCSGALLVLTFASAMGVFAAGIAAAFAMAVGTAITVSLLAVLAAGSRRLAAAAASGSAVWLGRLEGGLALAAGLALVLLGAVFLAAAFTPAPPMPFR